MITYYGFLSLFPLLLIFSTVLGFLLPDNPELQQQLIDSALSQFPIIGDQLSSSAQPLRGSGTGLAIGIVVALYGGLGVAVAIQNALNQVWGVPVNKRPDPLRARLRSLLLLGLLGIGVLLTTALSALATVGAGWPRTASRGGRRGRHRQRRTVRAGLPSAHRAQRQRPGRATGRSWPRSPGRSCSRSARYVGYQLQGSSQVYGLFGIVLGLFAWIYLEAVVIVLAAELNVVLVERLWPRALLAPFIEDVDLTHADRRSYESYASTQQYRAAETIDVKFEPPQKQQDDTSPS